jgi:hypothetical protein
MMVGNLIQQLVAPGTWQPMRMMGGMGMMGGGGMMGGMGGMMGGMGGMMGGMGGGMRSVPPTGPMATTLRADEEQSLPTNLVSLSGPNDQATVVRPAEGEKLVLSDVAQVSRDERVKAAVKRLGEDKAPENVAQLVMWNVAAGLDWATITRLSRGWANAHEVALARQFVRRLDVSALPAGESGVLYWDVTARDAGGKALAEEMKKLLDGQSVLGLTVKVGVPARPEGPALACRVALGAKGDEAVVSVSASGGGGGTWEPMGKFGLPAADKDHQDRAANVRAAELASAVTEGVLGRLVRVQLTKGPKVKGKDTFRIRIDNASPLILNGLALSGPGTAPDGLTMMAGFSLPPRRHVVVPAGAEAVTRLNLTKGVRPVAADLSGL